MSDSYQIATDKGMVTVQGEIIGPFGIRYAPTEDFVSGYVVTHLVTGLEVVELRNASKSALLEILPVVEGLADWLQTDGKDVSKSSGMDKEEFKELLKALAGG